jgi:ribokinase
VLIQLEIPEKAVIAATRYAAEKDIPVIIDAVSARADYPLDKLYPCEIFSPNETELETFTGIAPRNTESCLRAVIRLASMVEAKYYVIKMGGRGVFFYDGKYYNIIPAHDVEAVDTTAAGDIFTAALAAEYMRTGDIMRSVRYANVAGAISVTRAGALTSVPTEQDITEFIQNRGIKL